MKHNEGRDQRIERDPRMRNKMRAIHLVEHIFGSEVWICPKCGKYIWMTVRGDGKKKRFRVTTHCSKCRKAKRIW